MTGVSKLAQDQVDKALSELNTQLEELWAIKEGQLFKEFKFHDFIEAFGFMTQVALHAEKINHHPDWSNSYNRVVVLLSTHEVDGISDKDFKLANAIESFVAL